MANKIKWEDAERVIRNTDRGRVSRYKEYWNSIKPIKAKDYYRFWLFAFASVRTDWRTSCRIFAELKKLPVYTTKDAIERALIAAGSGMYKMRAKAIWEFNLKYWANTALWQPLEGESFKEARTRINSELYGIGLAKISFFFEMCQPDQCDVVCLDTHLLRLYGISNKKISDKEYLELEKHWCRTCIEEGLPSPLVRHIYWDDLQNQPDTRYWSHVLHRDV